MNSKLILKIAALGILCLWGYGFAHLIHMGTMMSPEECPHAVDSHELCSAIVSTQITEKTLQAKSVSLLLLIIPLVFLTYGLVQAFLKISNTVKDRYTQVYEHLFFRGILNPRAP